MALQLVPLVRSEEGETGISFLIRQLRLPCDLDAVGCWCRAHLLLCDMAGGGGQRCGWWVQDM